MFGNSNKHYDYKKQISQSNKGKEIVMTDTEKIINRVKKKFPDAKILFDFEKNLYIDINGMNLSEHHLFPPTKDPHRAWELAEISLKMTQNFNRTHPMRTELYSSNDKKKRINKRRKNKNMDYFGLFEND
jgi:hypothetical protein